MSTVTYPLARNAATGKNAINAILWGCLIAGALDATDGVIAYGFQGLNPIQVLQYIASGVLGPSSFKGGLATAGLGTLLHFFIAFVAAAVYVSASRLIPALNARPRLFDVAAVIDSPRSNRHAIGIWPWDPVVLPSLAPICRMPARAPID